MLYNSIKIIDGKLIFKNSISEDAGLSFSYGMEAARKIEDAGYDAYIVGGAVRDILLGKIPAEVDISTSAPEEVIQRIFKDAKRIFPKKYSAFKIAGKSWYVEIIRMRKDIRTMGRQAEVEFTDDLSEDLRRRDFTINAIALKSDLSIIDLFGGIDDIENRLIRTIGDAETRFTEDHLRILRAVRFASSLDFAIEKNTAEAIRKLAHLTKNLSPQWIWRELKKGLSAPHRFKKLLIEYDIWQNLFGEIFKNPQENFDALFRAKEGNISLAGILALFFYENSKNFYGYAQKLLSIVEIPKNLRNGFIEVAKIISNMKNLYSISVKERIKLLDSEFLSTALDVAEYIDDLRSTAAYIREKYTAIGSRPLISGGDLSGIEKSRRSEIMAKIRLAQLSGEIKSRSDALELLKKLQDE